MTDLGIEQVKGVGIAHPTVPSWRFDVKDGLWRPPVEPPGPGEWWWNEDRRCWVSFGGFLP